MKNEDLCIFLYQAYMLFITFSREISTCYAYIYLHIFLSQEIIKISSELQRKVYFFKEIILLDKILVCPDVRKSRFEN